MIWIIIGFYDWEVRGDGSKTCDLLEIYSPIEKEKLKQLEAHNLAAIMNIGEMEGTENEFTFSKFKEIEEEENIDSSSSEEEAIDKEIIAPAIAVKQPPIKTTINDNFMVDYYISHPEDFDNPLYNLKGVDISKYTKRPHIPVGPCGILIYLSNKSCNILINHLNNIKFIF